MAINRVLNTIVYDFIADLPIVGNRNEQYWVNENQSFYHYYNGVMTQIVPAVATGNGIFDVANDGGTVPTAYDVNITDTLAFAGTIRNMFNIGANTFSVDTLLRRVGIGTAYPTQMLDVLADVRFRTSILFGDTAKYIKGNSGASMEFNSAGNSMVFRHTSTGFMRGLPGQAGFQDSTFPSIDSSAVVTITSTTKGFLPPRMTTTQRDAISASAGLIIYNTSINKHQGYNGTIWKDFYESESTAKVANYTAVNGDFVLMTTGATTRTVTLPLAASSLDTIIEVKKVDSGNGNVIIEGNGAETIDGQLNITIKKQYTNIKMHCDGTEWWIK